MNALGSALVAILRAATGGTAYAQIYKWVDEAGQTHYSDTAPTGGKKPDTVADRISVYAPDPALLARLAAPAESNPVLSDRVDMLERQLQAERLARRQHRRPRHRARHFQRPERDHRRKLHLPVSAPSTAKARRSLRAASPFRSPARPSRISSTARR